MLRNYARHDDTPPIYGRIHSELLERGSLGSLKGGLGPNLRAIVLIYGAFQP